MNYNGLFTEEQLDYLVEMLNISAGNASTALSQLLQCHVDMKLPSVAILPPMLTASILGDPALPVAGLRMKMIGDLSGDLFFIVPDSEKMKLVGMAERNLLGRKEEPNPDQALGVLAEIGNIIAGVYLTAIHDFCKLNVCHSVPIPAVDMIQALLDECLAASSVESEKIIVVKNEFTVGMDHVHTFFLILHSRGSLNALVASMAVASKMYGNQ